MAVVQIKRDISPLSNIKSHDSQLIRGISVFMICEAYPCITGSVSFKEVISIDVQGLRCNRNLGKRYVGNLVTHAVGGIGKGHFIIVILSSRDGIPSAFTCQLSSDTLVRNILRTHKFAVGVCVLLPYIAGLLHLMIHQIQWRDFEPGSVKSRRVVVSPALRIQDFHGCRSFGSLNTHRAEIRMGIHCQIITMIHQKIAHKKIYIRIYLNLIETVHRYSKGIMMPTPNIVIAVVVLT